MRKIMLILTIAALVVLVLAVGAFAQKKPDIVGTWTGFAIVGDGSRVDLTAVLEKGQAGYTGKFSDATGMIPESPLKNIAFKDKKLTFEFDFTEGTESQLIKIELTLEGETLKGTWLDAEGNSDIIELTLKK